MNIFSKDCLVGGSYLVTGASSGIGRAAALLIAECGGKVILGGRDESRLRDTYLSLKSGPAHVLSVRDLVDADQTAEWVKELVVSVGPITGVFHAAGVDLIRPTRMTKQADLNTVFGASIFAAFGIARAVSQKNTLVDGGSVIFMSSVAGSTGQVGMTAYSASKAAIDGMVRSLACEMAPKRVRVNSIAAAAVKTEMHERMAKGSTCEVQTAYEKMHLLGFGNPSDIACAVVFLLSEASKWITGTNMIVDGGYMVR